MFVCVENVDELIDGFIHLMAIYYVFNVEYPSACKATLYFLQDILMEMPVVDHYRPTKYLSSSGLVK